MLPLIKKAIKHGDFPTPLRLQTACSGTDAPAIALQMFSEMFEELGDIDLNVDHVMSCEIEPFKQAYLARNFEGVKLFAAVTQKSGALNQVFIADVASNLVCFGQGHCQGGGVWVLLQGVLQKG